MNIIRTTSGTGPLAIPRPSGSIPVPVSSPPPVPRRPVPKIITVADLGDGQHLVPPSISDRTEEARISSLIHDPEDRYITISKGKTICGLYVAELRPFLVVIGLGLYQVPGQELTSRDQYRQYDVNIQQAQKAGLSGIMGKKDAFDFFMIDALPVVNGTKECLEIIYQGMLAKKDQYQRPRLVSLVSSEGLVEKLSAKFPAQNMKLIAGRAYGDVLDPHLSLYIKVR